MTVARRCAKVLSSRRAAVELPPGLLVLDVVGRVRTAGVLLEDTGGGGQGRIDWTRARYVETVPVDRRRRMPRRHVIDVGGELRVYAETTAAKIDRARD